MTSPDSVVANREDLVPVTIDGLEIAVPKGTPIIRAAEELGIQIPRFCDHPLLEPVGACRQCLVEVPDMGNGRGMPKPAAACTTTVMPGMVVKTQHASPVAERAQRGVMELLLINHPLDCPICDKGGECPLQNQAMSTGRADTRFRETKRSWPKPKAISANILLDRERCIDCQRCVRFADQIAGDPLIGLLARGAKTEIGPAEDTPFHSYFSGNVIQICPVGALTSAAYRFRSRPFDLRSTAEVCEHCASGCALRADWRRGEVTRRLAGADPAVNEEWNCDKGRFAFRYASGDDRLAAPLVRDESGQLVATSWSDAVDRAAAGLAEARRSGGVGVLPGGRLTEEDAYAYSKFARVALGTNDIDFRARPASPEEAEFLALLPGSRPGRGLSYDQLEQAKTVLLIAFEPEDESPMVFLRLRKAVRRHGLKVVSIAPLASHGLRKLNGTLIKTMPGQEAAAIAALDPSLGEGVLLVGERAATSPGALAAAHNLAAEQGGSIQWVPRRAGERGAVDAGALPNLLPGGRRVADADARAEVKAVWGRTPPAEPGRDLGAILAAARDGELAALVVGGVDPADLPDPALALAALDKVGFLVSLELRASAVTERADVVLPVAPIAEKAGRFVNWEGRRRPFDLTVTNAGALADHRVLDKLAGALEAPLGLPTVDAVRAELARLDGAARPAKLAVPAAPAPVAPSAGQAVLATWAELIDAGRMSDGEDSLAATARPARAVLSAATAEAAGLACGDAVTVSTERGAITVPAQVRDDIIDGVVWLPANARGCAVRASLGGGSGDVVRVAPATKAEPVAGEAAEGVAPDEVFASVERAEPAEEAETNTATAGGDQ